MSIDWFLRGRSVVASETLGEPRGRRRSELVDLGAEAVDERFDE